LFGSPLTGARFATQRDVSFPFLEYAYAVRATSPPRRSYANNRIDPRAHTAVDQLPHCPASALTSIILPFLENNNNFGIYKRSTLLTLIRFF
jgi:hypothetical protein